MAKVDKYFLGSKSRDFDYLDKKHNVNNNIGYMFNRTNIMFKYNNLPKTIPSKELELLLQTNGFGIFLKIDEDYYIVNGGLGGETDVYNRPTKAVISIPFLNYNDTLTINEDCFIINNDSLGIGLLPIYQKYSNLLNENMISMLIATVNKRVNNLISANDDNTVRSAEEYLKNVFDGKLGVIAESKLFDSLKVNPNSNQDNTLRDLIEFEQYIKASMYNEVGLSANFNMKKERLTEEEFITNSDSLFPLVDDMLNSRRKALEEINNHYGLEITVDFNSSWEYRNEQNLTTKPLEQDKDNVGIDFKIDDIQEKNIEPILEDEEDVEDEIGADLEQVEEEIIEDEVEENE